MAEQSTHEQAAVAEKVRRRLYRGGHRPAAIRIARPPEPSQRALSACHAVEDDGWITVHPRPWESRRRTSKQARHD
jgi:hypothetical protein